MRVSGKGDGFGGIHIDDCQSGQTCCSGTCCDGACCPSGKCCNGLCCPYSNGVCCDGASGGCCGSTQFCCNGNKCCPNGTECCADGTCCSHACDACLDNGTLEKVNPSATITVSADTVCVDDTITFTAPTVIDTGGLKWVNCAAVQLSGGVEYHWNLTLPTGYPAPLPPTSGTGSSVSVVAKVKGTYSASFTATPTRTECPPGNLALGGASADTGEIEITAERIDQDNPTNAAWQALVEGLPVYGGSEASTADNLTLSVSPGPNVSAILWSVEGPGGAAYAPPPLPTDANAVEWDLGDLLSPAPGEITFKVRVNYTYSSSRCGKFETEIGVRTDDVIVVGWINSQAVPLSTIGVDTSFILPTLTPTGSSSAVLCSQYITLLTQGDVQPNGISLVGATNPNRLYVLHWLFKFSRNLDPSVVIPGDFSDPTGHHVDEAKFSAFVNSLTTYKLINRYQVRYLAWNGSFTQTPAMLNRLAAIGWTAEPCGSGVAISGQGGANNGYLGSAASSVWHTNDGSPDAAGILAFNTLMGNAVPTNPLFWENIGSRIRFRANGDTADEVDTQVFPRACPIAS